VRPFTRAMKSLGAMGKVGIVLLLLNEVRGVLVVLSVLSAWIHADKAAPPSERVSVSAHPAPPTASAHAGVAGPAAPAPHRRAGS